VAQTSISKTPERHTLLPDELFDESSGYEDDVGIRLAPNLSPEDRKMATALYWLFNELWGFILVVGDPGTGKDVFANWLSYKLKTWFPWLRVLRDERPRRLYGEYAGIFDANLLKTDLAAMSAAANGARATDIDRILEEQAQRWVEAKGKALLMNSLLYLTELWRYMGCRDPHQPMNKTLGGLLKEKRHMGMLMLGTTQLASELDKFTCKPWIDWKVTCSRSPTNKTSFVYFVQKVKYDRRMDALVPTSARPFPIAFDAGKPRTNLGDGRIVIRKQGYQAQTEEERVVLAALSSGIETYEELVDVLDDEGDMLESETLATLKDLKFNKRKMVLAYPDYFGLFNSRSAPQIKTSVKD
jgi:hypothetical protein